MAFFLHEKAGSNRPAFEALVEAADCLEASADGQTIAMLYWAMGKHRQHKNLSSLLLRSRSYDFVNHMLSAIKTYFSIGVQASNILCSDEEKATHIFNDFVKAGVGEPAWASHPSYPYWSSNLDFMVEKIPLLISGSAPLNPGAKRARTS